MAALSRLGLLALAGYVATGAANAAELKIMCPPPMRTAIVELVARFEQATSHKVTLIHIPSRFIIDRVRGGEAVDVTVLTDQATDTLTKEGKLVRGIPFARSSIGIAVLAGAPKPDASSPEALKRTLLSVKSFARNEGAESGAHMLSVFAKLGIVEEMKAKTKAMPINTGYVAQLVADRQVEMAAQQMPELMAVQGVFATPLPAELNTSIVFAFGIAATSREQAAAQALATHLTSQAAAEVLRAKGLQPM